MTNEEAMTSINERYASRIAASRGRIEGVYRHRENDIVPFVVADVNYWVSGETPELIPGDYFTDCGTMLRYQTGKIEHHMATYDDDYIPFLFPWYGTGAANGASVSDRMRSSGTWRTTSSYSDAKVITPEK